MRYIKVVFLVLSLFSIILFSCKSKPKFKEERLLNPLSSERLDTIYIGKGEDWNLMLTRQEVYIYYTLYYPSQNKTLKGRTNQFNGYDLQGCNYYLKNDSLKLHVQILNEECEQNNETYTSKVILNNKVGCGSNYDKLFINH